MGADGRRGAQPARRVELIASYRPLSVLDGGCGTGRVAIELARRGVGVVGVDAAPDMIAAARAKAPELEWVALDLADLTRDDRFDVVVLAGNLGSRAVRGRGLRGLGAPAPVNAASAPRPLDRRSRDG